MEQSSKKPVAHIAVSQPLYMQLDVLKQILAPELRSRYGARRTSMELIIKFLLDEFYNTERGKRIKQLVSELVGGSAKLETNNE